MSSSAIDVGRTKAVAATANGINHSDEGGQGTFIILVLTAIKNIISGGQAPSPRFSRLS